MDIQQQQETYHFLTAPRPVLGPTQLTTPPPPYSAFMTCAGTAVPFICTAHDGIYEWLREPLVTYNINTIFTLDTPFCFIYICYKEVINQHQHNTIHSCVDVY